MLRGMVLLLLLANGLFYAWRHDHLKPLGWAPTAQREPQRLAQQIEPDRVRLDAAADTRSGDSAAAPTPAPTAPAAPAVTEVPAAAPAPAAPEGSACWKADGLNAEQAKAWRQRLAAMPLPDGSWTLQPVGEPARWLVYMGRYDEAQLERKKSELDKRGVEYRELKGGPLALGLSLGSFESEAAAQQALDALRPKGVRSARVSPERPDLLRFELRLPSLGAEQARALADQAPALRRCD